MPRGKTAMKQFRPIGRKVYPMRLMKIIERTRTIEIGFKPLLEQKGHQVAQGSGNEKPPIAEWR